jgi:hypothetical protein
MSELPIACDCGALRGHVDEDTRRSSNHLVCLCESCQRFAGTLDRPDVLDAHGGTELVQLRAARVHFDSGRDQLACLRITEGGPLRWYAACCGTPIANTGSAQALAFAGLFRACIRVDDETLVAAVGPVRMRVNARDAKQGPVEGPGVHAGFPAAVFLWLVPRLIGWRLSGAHRDSPFFDRETGAPVATPR